MKLSQFNVFMPAHIEGTIIAYNTFTGSYFTCPEAELAQIEELCSNLPTDAGGSVSSLLDKLIHCGFVIGDEVDERAQLRQRYALKKRATGNVALTLAPTINCNFGCTYCFQEHPKKRMSDDDVAALKRYVEQQLGTDATLHVTWFGGEPLLAFHAIEELTPFLTAAAAERGSRFRQSMVTNGSLLDAEKVEFFAGQANVDFMQITLDGPPVVHDKRRMMSGGRATFERILTNIEYACERLPITIRINIDRTNKDRLAEFVDLLVARGIADRVSLYLGHLLPYTEVCGDVESVALSKEEFAGVQADFDFSLVERGFRPPFGLPKPRFGNLCIADNPRGAVVSPGGLIFRCWNEVAATEDAASGLLNTRGDVTSDGAMKANREQWTQYDPFAHEQCRTCKVAPLCVGGCPWETRKKPVWSTGHCTPLKWNLPDRLRLYHLKEVVDRHPPVEQITTSEARPEMATAVPSCDA